MYHHIERCRGLRRNHQDLPRTVDGLLVLNGLQPALRQIPAVCLSSDFHSGASPLSIMIIEGTGFEREWEPPAEFLRPILSNENDARRRFQIYASAVDGDVATLDEIREAVTTLEDTDRIARRVLGSAHPLVVAIGRSLKNARSVLRARETPPPPP